MLAKAFPISIDAEGFEELARSEEVAERAEQIREDLGRPEKVFLGIDRLDYTKGIYARLRAFSELIADGHFTVEDAVFVQVATPSRERVDQYRKLRDDIDRLVGRINGDLGRIGRPAISYLHSSFPREEMAALYRAADIMVVTPFRDGMNLVAKEYVACRYDDDGALVLSEFAGAADELRQAYLVNPYDINGMKAKMLEAYQAEPQGPVAPHAGDAQDGGRERRLPLGVLLPRPALRAPSPPTPSRPSRPGGPDPRRFLTLVRLGRVDEQPVVEREAVRVVLLDGNDRVLLIEMHDPARPGPRLVLVHAGRGTRARREPAPSVPRVSCWRRPASGSSPADLGPVVHEEVIEYGFEGHAGPPAPGLPAAPGRVVRRRHPRAGTRPRCARRGSVRWWTPEELSGTSEAVHPVNLLELVTGLVTRADNPG